MKPGHAPTTLLCFGRGAVPRGAHIFMIAFLLFTFRRGPTFGIDKGPAAGSRLRSKMFVYERRSLRSCCSTGNPGCERRTARPPERIHDKPAARRKLLQERLRKHNAPAGMHTNQGRVVGPALGSKKYKHSERRRKYTSMLNQNPINPGVLINSSLRVGFAGD